MSFAALVGLAGLALVDSTSFGTLILPLMMLLAPRVRTRNVIIYLVTIGSFYFAIGVGLLSGARLAVGAIGPALASDTGRYIQLAFGAALVIVSFLIDPRIVARLRARRGLPPKPPGAWRQRALGADARLGTIISVALLAGLVEVASMLPYLAAVGILVAAGGPIEQQMAILGGYVVIMVLPALVLLVLRRAAGARVEPRLQKMEAWIARRTNGAASWVVGIIGVLIALDALGGLL